MSAVRVESDSEGDLLSNVVVWKVEQQRSLALRGLSENSLVVKV